MRRILPREHTPAGFWSLRTLIVLARSDSFSSLWPELAREAGAELLRLAQNAPALERTEVSFWAIRGRGTEVEIRLAPGGGDDDGEEFLEFEIPEDALLAYPDGRRFARGDSVRITIRVVDPTRFVFEFQPAGLKFDPRHPAELEVSYEWADPDYDGDGDRDSDDAEIEREFGFWRQERAGQPWFRVGTVRVEEMDEAEAKITGFSKYALAGGH